MTNPFRRAEIFERVLSPAGCCCCFVWLEVVIVKFHGLLKTGEMRLLM